MLHSVQAAIQANYPDFKNVVANSTAGKVTMTVNNINVEVDVQVTSGSSGELDSWKVGEARVATGS